MIEFIFKGGSGVTQLCHQQPLKQQTVQALIHTVAKAGLLLPVEQLLQLRIWLQCVCFALSNYTFLCQSDNKLHQEQWQYSVPRLDSETYKRLFATEDSYLSFCVKHATGTESASITGRWAVDLDRAIENRSWEFRQPSNQAKSGLKRKYHLILTTNKSHSSALKDL